ncbi:limbic system-associated membrane protein isoform X1 [Balaenoptera acutorostrata]|uniref:Limbic system-associated membrane protein isoform X1 n=1 Tax=Balaenoptera acutorostrata TaxID=9767 RepID=A0ABM3TGE7_BALAC|nr:limbic system-associated membrane protein isoform X1 [Balaenoptera acutorostrata]
MVARVQPDRKQLPLVLLRLLCLLPTGLPVRSVDFNRGTDNITVRQGDTAILRCVVEDKNSKVAWLNRSGIIFAGHDKWSLDPRVELEKRHSLEYSLRIQKVDVYDEGSYTCSVQTQHEPKTSQVYLIVQVPPKISNISSDVTVNEGSNVTLVCMANGRPEPVITWRHLTPTVLAAEKSKIKMPADSVSGREFEGEEEYLEILGITREQSGKYECKAANEVSSADVKQVKVTVNYPPTITESKSNEATTGRKASLKCEASAVPAPDFEWYRDDTRINSANGLEIKSTEGQSSLTVTNVTEEHYGNYTCVAANNLGVTNASLVLFKRVLPTVPHPIQEIGTTVHFKQKGPGSVRGINGSISLAVPLWLLAASLLCLLSKC